MAEGMKPFAVLARALVFAACGWAAAASAQDAANGQRLYGNAVVSGKQSCSNNACHGSLPGNPQNRIVGGVSAPRIKTALGGVSQMSFLSGKLTDSELNDIAAYISATLGGTPSYIAVSGAPSVGVSPASLQFASQNIGTTSAAQTVVVSNATGAAGALMISGIDVTSGSDFAVSGGSCMVGASVSAGANCSITVQFKPTAVGARAASLTVRHNGSGGSSTVSLAGTAVDESPAMSLSPTSLSFSRVVGGTSQPQRITVSSTGTAPLKISSISLGGAQPGDYAIDGSSTCAAGGSVASGSSCFVAVSFKPTAQGARNASLAIAHNAAGSSASVSLNGTGNATAQPGIALDATSLDLGQQVVGATGAARTLTLTNNGESGLSFTAIRVIGTDAAEVVLGGTCAVGAVVPMEGSCTVTAALKPVTLGSKSATIEIASNAPSGTASISLAGSGINAPQSEVSLSQVALGFGAVKLGTSSTPRVITLTNTGTGPLAVTGIESSSAEFSVTHDCPASLAVKASCKLNVVYRPAVANAAESILVVTDAPSSPNSIVLTGLGTTADLPTLAWQGSTTSLSFASTAVGSASASQSLVLVNQGPGSVTLGTAGVSGADASSFTVTAGSGCTAGATLAQGASCMLQVGFVPGASGVQSAMLQVASDGTAPPDVQLSGTGVGASGGNGGDSGGGTGGGTGGGSTGGGSLATSAVMLDYRSIGLKTGQRSEPLSVLVRNTSAATATISAVTTTGPFVLTDNQAADACRSVPWTLPPGASCTVTVVYAPGTSGDSSGVLTVQSASGQKSEVMLAGQATTEMTNVGGGAIEPVLLLWLALIAAAVFVLRGNRVQTPTNRSKELPNA